MHTLRRLMIALVLAGAPALALRSPAAEPGAYRPTETQVTNLTFTPASPAVLPYDERVNLRYDYVTTEADGVRIQSHPLSHGVVNLSYGANPSPLYKGQGPGTAFFTLRATPEALAGNSHVDGFRLTVSSADWKRKLLTLDVPVDFTFSSSAPAPAAAAEPVAAADPASADAPADQRRGSPFPSLEFTALTGERVSVGALTGKVVLVDFWATWCGPCRREVPALVALYEEAHKQGFEIVGISLDRREGDLRAYTADQRMTWPQYFDGKGWNNAVAERFGINSIPATFLIDRNGNWYAVGLRGYSLRQAVRTLLRPGA